MAVSSTAVSAVGCAYRVQVAVTGGGAEGRDGPERSAKLLTGRFGSWRLACGVPGARGAAKPRR